MHILQIKVVCDKQEVLEWYKKKVNESSENSGFDLIFPNDIIITTNKAKIDFEIQCQLACCDECDGKHGYFLMARSSIHDADIRLSNNVGLIDYQYRGNIKAGVDNISEYKEYVCCTGSVCYDDDDIRSHGDIAISAFTRLFQLVMPDAKPFKVEIVDELTSTERGSGGFGSTGK
jgi:dUTP pyrophosphatase